MLHGWLQWAQGMDSGWVAALATATALLSGLATAAVMILNARHKNRLEEKQAARDDRAAELKAAREQREAVLREEESAIDKWKELYNLQQRQIVEQGELIDELFEMDSACQVQLTELYGYLQVSYVTMQQFAIALARHGEKVEVPALPPRPANRVHRKHAEFKKREIAQDAAIMAEITATSDKQPAPKEV